MTIPRKKFHLYFFQFFLIAHIASEEQIAMQMYFVEMRLTNCFEKRMSDIILKNCRLVFEIFFFLRFSFIVVLLFVIS